jgi:hypothetical protein
VSLPVTSLHFKLSLVSLHSPSPDIKLSIQPGDQALTRSIKVLAGNKAQQDIQMSVGVIGFLFYHMNAASLSYLSCLLVMSAGSTDWH